MPRVALRLDRTPHRRERPTGQPACRYRWRGVGSYVCCLSRCSRGGRPPFLPMMVQWTPLGRAHTGSMSVGLGVTGRPCRLPRDPAARPAPAPSANPPDEALAPPGRLSLRPFRYSRGRGWRRGRVVAPAPGAPRRPAASGWRRWPAGCRRGSCARCARRARRPARPPRCSAASSWIVIRSGTSAGCSAAGARGRGGGAAGRRSGRGRRHRDGASGDGIGGAAAARRR